MIEIESNGEVHTFSFDHNKVKTQEICSFNWSRKDGIVLVTGTKTSNMVSKNAWGIGTNKFHKVSMILPSPNFWTEPGIGNKHYFFMLPDAKSDEAARGFFNEFLTPEFDQHRKVFEVLGDKLKVPSSHSQLSGLGFSVTQRGSILCRVTSSFNRVVRVNF